MNAESTIVPFPSHSAHPVCNAHRFADLLDRYDRPGPRYTSYPTIDQCAETAGPEAMVQALASRAVGGLQRPLSLYVHVPFCASVCYYCACNKVITKKYDQVENYLRCIEKEARWVQMHNAAPTPVVQFHLGGGTPTFLTDADLTRLVATLHDIFHFSKHAEKSIEVDPRTVDEQRLKHLRVLGFNRLSFGVQDFDPLVQKAVHREQSEESVRTLVRQARALGFESINVDLIYGLPHQTPSSFERTLQQLVNISPDRIALYGYAHLPERFKPQRRIHIEHLPRAVDRIDILDLAIQTLTLAGYDYIGMDHFAKPNDPLSKAKRQGLLHRNFQGYTTQPDADLIGLGVSAISRLGTTLVQNTRDLEEYCYGVDNQGSAVFRGHVSDRDDLVRHSVIMALLCQGEVDYADFRQTHWVEFSEYFEKEIPALAQFVSDGLIEFDDNGFRVTAEGWFFVRPLAMVFDRYARQSSVSRSKVL